MKVNICMAIDKIMAAHLWPAGLALAITGLGHYLDSFSISLYLTHKVFQENMHVALVARGHP